VCLCLRAARIEDNYSAYGSYDGGDYDDGYGDNGYGSLTMYGAYGSRGRGASMRGGMGNGRMGSRGRGRAGRVTYTKGLYESATGHSVHMRGLPYAATESDIIQVILQSSSTAIQWYNSCRAYSCHF